MAPAPLGSGGIDDAGTSDFSFASSFVSDQLAQLAMAGAKPMPKPLSVVCPNIIESEDAVTAKPLSTNAHHPLPADLVSDGTASGDVTDDDEANGDGEEEEDLPALEPAAAQVAFSLSQKKRADYDAFDSWLSQNRDSITKTTKTMAAALCDEDKTAAALVREFESAKIIESPRDYQIELFEKAKQKNIIAVLDTGSGKTLIAALLLRHMIERELDDRENGQPHRVSFFLIDKVALVFQQHAVLECNLSQPVAKFSGDKSDMRWSSKDFWDATLQEHMVIVCTADILLKCLHHSYICMDQINLLIFDEAHHTKKNHSYARIIKDFYPFRDITEGGRRPKIFGMTASPVDARTNVTQAAQELEALLHSEIATIAHNNLLHEISKPKKERIVHYHTALVQHESNLMRRLRQLVGNHKLFARNFQYADANLSVLGPWIIDRFWQILFRTEELAKQEAKAEIERQPDDEGAGRNPLKLDGLGDEPVQYNSNVVAVRDASRFVELYRFVPPTMAQLSNKVQRLHDALFDVFTRFSGQKTRCIVFVEQRYTATLLADLFQQEQMKIPNLRTGVLVGGGSKDMGKNTFRTQLLTISKFKRGQVNCLFATSIAEEGLDIPDCNLVIRFDLYGTMIQYIQSRGRARHQESTYIHMAELGNVDHRRLLAENKASENKMRDFCNALPENRKLEGNDIDMDYFLRDETDQQVYVVPSTQAKLTYRSSLVILAQYVSTLPEPSEGVPKPEYSVFCTADGFVCEVVLPSSSPIRQATGRPHSRKQVAKCAAAFAMCLKLYEKKYIDKHLHPIFASRLPAMRNARLAVSSKKQAQYTMRVKPETWSVLGMPTQLYASILSLTQPESLDRPSRPLVFLSRHKMPLLPEFPLFFSKGRASKARCVPVDIPMQPTPNELEALAAYTLRAFYDVFSKEYEGTSKDMPYFIAPYSEPTHDVVLPDKSTCPDARSILDWTSIHHVAAQIERITCQGDEPDSFFENKFVSDPFDGSRKFYLRQVRRDMSALDPVPEGAPAPKHRAWNRPDTVRNILNYSVSLWSKSRVNTPIRQDQVVVEADIVYQRRNLLDERVFLDDFGPSRCFIVLDTLRISPIPVDSIAMIFNLPPIIHRIESTLIALEAAAVIGLPSIHPGLALEACTKDCDVSDDAGATETAINFQAGMGRNYERLELLGDSFLKMASTIALYTLAPDKNEFEYHVERMCMICNKNLFNNALEIGLEEYIRSKEFDRAWYPPVVDETVKLAAEAAAKTGTPDENGKTPTALHGLILKKGRKQQEGSYHALSDKSIADVCEAMIGAAYLTTYEERDFDLAVQAVSVVAKSKFHPMRTYKEYFAAYVLPEWQIAPATAAQVHMAKAVARDVGYTFTYPRLLRCAVMHPSYPRVYEQLPSYQRLEFLGDALFDMAAVDYLFHKYPDKDPQWLTEHKMAMVSNQFLGTLSVTLGFHKHLLSFTGDLQKQIMEYVAKIEDARTRAEAEAVAAGKPSAAFARDYWVHVTRPMKVLADVLEAYIGAIFVDSGYDYYGTVLPFFHRHVLPYFEDMTLYDTFANKHPVTFAVNVLTQRFGCRDWRAVVQETPDNEGDGCVTFATKAAAGFLVHGRVLGHGIAESGRYAKIAAAKQALAKLDSLGVEAFRALTGCDCHVEAEAETVAEVMAQEAEVGDGDRAAAAAAAASTAV
ncbi:endoribonuclease Dicer [Sporothrix schenckii 1099-18]|uniref:Dicer-like protein 1 n=1 Tax=Sporothrix schenckii 1099-18 TaxID=1397361 RepID=A0A0F2M0V4_SPOSC|nr:endoribonuclease Dicer [Sporothrix schenckii 1099-18]KJR82385.1 endoribonuclease Dicer [Sporothrix schenckii 1099-18]